MKKEQKMNPQPEQKMKPRGRPRKNDNPTVKILVQMTPKLAMKIDAKVKKMNWNRTSLIDIAVENYLKANP
jgi:hypothetical protein